MIRDSVIQPAVWLRPQRAWLSSQREQVAAARLQGIYSQDTLQRFRKIWQQSRQPADLAAYLLFRRALGLPLSRRRLAFLQLLLHRPRYLRWIFGLLPDTVGIFQRLVQENQRQCPAQPAWLHQQLHAQQTRLEQWMQRCRAAGRIAVVGNGVQVQGSQAGQAIDSADLVIRFNHCRSNNTSEADCGSKTDIWVVAPGYRGPVFDAELVVLSGPAMLWQLQKLDYLQQLNRPVLQIPLSSWRQLVRRFNAPPSAAPLFCQLLIAHGVKPQQLELYGVGQSLQSRYHHALPDHTPSHRHNWTEEQRWWQQLKIQQ